jgi:FlaA1/EpsC-like NDP-sugar epimerase
VRASEIVDWFSSLSRSHKRMVAAALDVTVLPICLWAAFALRLSSIWPQQLQMFWWLFLVAPATALPIFAQSGLYSAVIRYIGSGSFYMIARAVGIHGLVVSGLMAVVGFRGFPRSVLIIYSLLCLLAVAGLRYGGRSVLHYHLNTKTSPRRVLIFGAGSAGAELAHALQNGSCYLPVAFVDDKRLLHGNHVQGLKVYPTAALPRLIEKFSIDEILLAIPAASRARRRQVLAVLEPLPVPIKTVPEIKDLVTGRAGLQDLRALDIDDVLDLLGREPVAPDRRLLTTSITGKAVMVTGAGGSIGSELCRQICRLRPARLVLFEVSEPSLYQIHRELEAHQAACADIDARVPQIIPILGSVCHRSRVRSVIRAFTIETIYHAAAYKHVPLVECNPTAGVQNNVFGTLHTATAALEEGVETFILISTDKAVRPTNVMGAAKRVAELILQGLAARSTTTRFSMVRFGNVVGSSGSVIPLFNEQIARGGPITVTHPDVVRYFMTIPEAAELVLQASAMGKGGDVFVLNMGESLRILDVARRMVGWKGMSVRDQDNPDGEIEIRFTGLRAGEKLYEELLLRDDVLPTEHPLIMRAQEACLPWSELSSILERLEEACENFDSGEVRALLLEANTGYQPQGEIPDPVWRNMGSSTPAGDRSAQATLH